MVIVCLMVCVVMIWLNVVLVCDFGCWGGGWLLWLWMILRLWLWNLVISCLIMWCWWLIWLLCCLWLSILRLMWVVVYWLMLWVWWNIGKYWSILICRWCLCCLISWVDLYEILMFFYIFCLLNVFVELMFGGNLFCVFDDVCGMDDVIM